MNQSLPDFIKSEALKAGFDVCGIARAEQLAEDAAYLDEWLKNGYSGEMSYLERNFDKRTNPCLLIPGCKSVIVVGMNYYTDKKQPKDAPKVGKYAFSEEDYHNIIKNRLKELKNNLCKELGDNIVNPEYQHLFTDSAPVLERRWAERAGLGWIGKSSMLINPMYGSYVLLGELMLNIEMPCYDEPISNRCGDCEKCVNACPVNAITDKFLIANRCISYNTIERKSCFSKNERINLSGYICGCDICIETCPWNEKLTKPHNNEDLKTNEFILKADKNDWNKLTENDFNRIFRNSALKRAGFTFIKRNLLNI